MSENTPPPEGGGPSQTQAPVDCSGGLSFSGLPLPTINGAGSCTSDPNTDRITLDNANNTTDMELAHKNYLNLLKQIADIESKENPDYAKSNKLYREAMRILAGIAFQKLEQNTKNKNSDLGKPSEDTEMEIQSDSSESILHSEAPPTDEQGFTLIGQKKNRKRRKASQKTNKTKKINTEISPIKPNSSNNSNNIENINQTHMETNNNEATNVKDKNINNNLQTDEQNDTSGFQFDKKATKIPPIIVKDPKVTWKILSKELDEVVPDQYTAKINGSDTFTIKVNSPDAHRKTTKLFENKNYKFHSYILPDDKDIKIVIRSLPYDADLVEIQQELAKLGFMATKVVQLTSYRNGERIKIPLYVVTLPKTKKSEEIYHIQYLMRLRITVEHYRGRRGPPQCHRCQQFFHAQNSCRHEPKCVKCAGQHLTNECTKSKEEPPKCANCDGTHTANFSGCPKNPLSPAALYCHSTLPASVKK